MQIQINADHNIESHEALSAHVSSVVENTLSQISNSITRVEVHLSDENSDMKTGKDDMRCVMEARLEGLQPLAVTHHAETLHQAVDGAADKLYRIIDSTLSRLSSKKSHRDQASSNHKLYDEQKPVDEN